MTNSDEDLPHLARKLLVPPVLDMLGVAELTEYIAVLEGEIARVRGVIASKQAHAQAAASFFKLPKVEES